MYGLLLESLADFIRMEYGEDKWEEIRRLARVDQPTFSTHRVYSDSIIPRLAQAATKVLGISNNDMFKSMGYFFVDYVSQYGYDRVLSILGRHMRDFLNGLDNLHEYLKFSYPRMKAPSFFCDNENQYGLILHYRSKRKGYVYYTMGQIEAVGRRFYNTDVTIKIVKEELLMDAVHITFQLHFENTAYLQTSTGACAALARFPPVKPQLFFEVFPFCIVFGGDMVIRNIGRSLHAIMPDLRGKKMTDAFTLARPMIEFTWQTVLRRTNNIFELVTAASLTKNPPDDDSRPREAENLTKASSESDTDGSDDDCTSWLSLKGQMLFMEEWKSIIFLGTPVMPDLEAMAKAGLYINDLSMHDFSRELMLAGTQQSVELKLALDQEQQKSKRLEESMHKLDEEMKRTDELLYQMIPKAVADRLRKGTPAVNTCEVFDKVTILFSDVVTFTQICSRISPLEVVSMLNSMYSIFDQLTSMHHVYKVETIGDAYMVVSGAPEKRINHAQKVCNMALDMMQSVGDLKDPSTGDSIRIRIGMHSGTVVAGIVGLKMPRYCLFGDTVNTASRMESTSEPMKIHISESTKELLNENEYEVALRGTVSIKGKGNMKTYWLVRKMLLPSLDDAEALPSRRSPMSKSRSSSLKDESRPSSRSLYSPITLEEVEHLRQQTSTRQHAKTWSETTFREREQQAAASKGGSGMAPAVGCNNTSQVKQESQRTDEELLKKSKQNEPECPTHRCGNASETEDGGKLELTSKREKVTMIPCIQRSASSTGEHPRTLSCKKLTHSNSCDDPTESTLRKNTPRSNYCSIQ